MLYISQPGRLIDDSVPSALTMTWWCDQGRALEISRLLSMPSFAGWQYLMVTSWAFSRSRTLMMTSPLFWRQTHRLGSVTHHARFFAPPSCAVSPYCMEGGGTYLYCIEDRNLYLLGILFPIVWTPGVLSMGTVASEVVVRLFHTDFNIF